MVLNPNNSVRARVRQSAVIREEGGLSVLTFHAMGTRCRVMLQEPSRNTAENCFDHLLNWVADFEAKYSRFLDTSLVSRINAAAGKEWVSIDEETQRLLALCSDLFFFTRGSFDPTALPLIRLWNWKANPPQIPDDAAISRAREIVGWNKLQLKPGAIFLPRAGMCLDFGGIGKEYAVDMAIALVMQQGVENVLVDFGQDIRVHGKPPGRPAWHIGLEDPKNPGRCWTGVAVTDHAVATSGDYLRHFLHQGRRYGHIIDPRNGYPVNSGTLSVSVIAPHCTFAGILSTAVFVLGPKDGFDLMRLCPGVEGCITTETARHQTKGFHAYTTS